MGHLNFVNFNGLLCLQKRIRHEEIEFFLSFLLMYCWSKPAITERSYGCFLNKNLSHLGTHNESSPIDSHKSLRVTTPAGSWAVLTVGRLGSNWPPTTSAWGSSEPCNIVTGVLNGVESSEVTKRRSASEGAMAVWEFGCNLVTNGSNGPLNNKEKLTIHIKHEKKTWKTIEGGKFRCPIFLEQRCIFH